MNIIDIPPTPITGTFQLKRYLASTGEILEEYVEHNAIVNDSKEAIINAISTTTTLGVIGELQVGEDVGAQSTLTGNPIVDFVDNGGSPDTIVRASGDFLVDDEFLDGMSIVVTNTVSNNNTFTIDTVTATTITLIAGDALTTETVATNTSIVGTPSPSNPRLAKVTETDSSMSLINIPTDTTPFTIGYASKTSVSFSTTVSGDVVLSAYPLETTKIITSAGLYTGNDKVFAYKRFPQKSISALINIDITWTIQF